MNPALISGVFVLFPIDCKCQTRMLSHQQVPMSADDAKTLRGLRKERDINF